MNSGNGFLNILLGLIICVLVGYAIFYYFQHQQRKDIEALEKTREDLLKIPVADHIYKLKKMPLTGQSLRDFDSHQATWQTITRFSFPEIETEIAKAKEANERFNLVQANKHLNQGKEQAEKTKTSIENVYKQLQLLLESEAENRQKFEWVNDKFKELRKQVLSQSVLFKGALPAVEKRLAYVDNDFDKFQNLSTAGDHVGARACLDEIEKEINELTDISQQIPDLTERLDHDLVAQIADIRSGYQQMVDQQFVFHKLDVLSEISELEQEVKKATQALNQIEVVEAKQVLDRLERDVDQLYDKLEAEVEAKTYVLHNTKAIHEQIVKLQHNNHFLGLEIDRLSQNYVLEDSHQANLDKVEEQLDKEQRLLQHYDKELEGHSVAYSVVATHYEVLEGKLQSIFDEQQALMALLSSLKTSEDELKANLDGYELEMRNMKRFVEKYHLPGLPKSYLQLFFKNTDLIEKLVNELDRVKIDLNELKDLDNAINNNMEKLDEQTEAIVDQARLTEASIQYANRYRLEDEQVARAIQSSLQVFDSTYDYEKALHIIQAELERVEPGSSRKVQQTYFSEKDKRLI
ncbi:selenide, water dikinase [Atopobacter sp. AH10]|uniref:septation ring formation regulator EzrA n=1 Tax=Atopobacter sp. AH10 TaxID=2315861 RepID=UPI000EF1D63A|nr:septation ring formation regulator EzrA [Atopobacter sp. AH10]RLK62960.1 selenide, water dikinase [Atopobacter sp. AH10]